MELAVAGDDIHIHGVVCPLTRVIRVAHGLRLMYDAPEVPLCYSDFV